MFLLSLALLAQVPQPELQHGGDVYWKDRGWVVYAYPDEQQCDLTAELSNGEMLTLYYNAKERLAGFVATNKHATLLRQDQVVHLDVHFISRGKTLKSWNDVAFTAKVDPSAGRVLVSDTLDPSFIDDFAKADMFGVFTGKNFVSGSPLPGSAAASAKLVSCAKVAGGIDPHDPFQK